MWVKATLNIKHIAQISFCLSWKIIVEVIRSASKSQLPNFNKK